MSTVWALIEGILAGVGALFITIIVGGVFARRRIRRNQ